MPVAPATHDTKVGRWPDSRRLKLQWTMIAPLHSGLGNSVRPFLKNKIKTDTNTKMTQMLALSDKDLKAAK